MLSVQSAFFATKTFIEEIAAVLMIPTLSIATSEPLRWVLSIATPKDKSSLISKVQVINIQSNATRKRSRMKNSATPWTEKKSFSSSSIITWLKLKGIRTRRKYKFTILTTSYPFLMQLFRLYIKLKLNKKPSFCMFLIKMVDLQFTN
jgi:hypothetical protein